MKRSEPPNTFELENLEPRIMLSGDPLTGAVADSIITGKPDPFETGQDQPPIEEILYPVSDALQDTPYQESSQYDPYKKKNLTGIYSGLAEADPFDDDAENAFEDAPESTGTPDQDTDTGQEDLTLSSDRIIGEGEDAAIIQGLEELANLGRLIEDFDAFQSTLPLTDDVTIGGLLRPYEILDDRLSKPVYDYFSDAKDPPSSEGLIAVLEGITSLPELGAIDTQTGGINNNPDELRSVINFRVTREGPVYSDAGRLTGLPAVPTPFEFTIDSDEPGDILLRVNGSDLEIVNKQTGEQLARKLISRTSEIIIQGVDDQDDTLTVDFTGGLIEAPITFHGGAGGFDSLIIEGGSFNGSIYVAAGPDSGTITLDSLVISYTGLEPITDNNTVDDRVFNGPASGNRQIRIINDPTSGYTKIDDNGTTAFESVSFKNPANTLTINAGTGDDTILIESLDDGFQAAVIINGGGGNDTITGPDAPNTWKLTGTNEGTLTADLSNLTNGPVTFDFNDIENITGGSETDSFTFDEDGGVTGTIDDAAGIKKISLGSFVTLSGAYDFDKGSKTFTLSDGSTVTANYLTVGASSGTVFAGSGGDTDNPLGFNATLDEFALVIIVHLASGRSWQALTGTLSSASFSGVDGLT
ncbi:MAG: LEPR-XLL domain-containing protein, partial [Deltaproteobacteria bacterium]|nr:LEPR-XLL domain-containing protein [Deltaproteobacteria bacterium]